jgi:hypothetical protein
VTGNAGTATALQTARTIGGVSFNGTANITVATATGGFTVSGGNLALGTNSLTMTGSIASTGSRVTKGWFTDLESTNAIVGSITGNAATVTTNANLTGPVTSSGNATTITNDAVTFAKIQNITSDRLIGRDTASSGDPEEITVSGGLEWTGSGGIQRSALTGDVAASAGSNTTTLATVNSNVGSFKGTNFTVNGKGLITAASAGTFSKSITIETPTNAENISIFHSDEALTITKIVAVLRGSSTPSVTWTIRKGSDRSAAGTEVVTSGTTTTSTTTGSVVTSFNSAGVTANDFVWMQTTAQSGTVTEISITVYYTKN